MGKFFLKEFYSMLLQTWQLYLVRCILVGLLLVLFFVSAFRSSFALFIFCAVFDAVLQTLVLINFNDLFGSVIQFSIYLYNFLADTLG